MVLEVEQFQPPIFPSSSQDLTILPLHMANAGATEADWFSERKLAVGLLKLRVWAPSSQGKGKVQAQWVATDVWLGARQIETVERLARQKTKL